MASFTADGVVNHSTTAHTSTTISSLQPTPQGPTASPISNKVGSSSLIVATRTLGYAEYGLAGWFTVFVRGMLCNWMVSTGVVGAQISTTVSGKVIAMWMPIMLFFYMVFEHSVVNMFLFPTALMMGGDFSFSDYFWWNEVPTVLGNLVGGLTVPGQHVRAAPQMNVSGNQRPVPAGILLAGC